jgi:hypothetical protein
MDSEELKYSRSRYCKYRKAQKKTYICKICRNINACGWSIRSSQNTLNPFYVDKQICFPPSWVYDSCAYYKTSRTPGSTLLMMVSVCHLVKSIRGKQNQRRMAKFYFAGRINVWSSNNLYTNKKTPLAIRFFGIPEK